MMEDKLTLMYPTSEYYVSIKKTRRTAGVDKALYCLLCKSEALSSNPSPSKKQNKNLRK
jgi:hypothetical protein